MKTRAGTTEGSGGDSGGRNLKSTPKARLQELRKVVKTRAGTTEGSEGACGSRNLEYAHAALYVDEVSYYRK